MSLIFVSNWQELLSEMYMLIVADPALFNYSDDNNAFIKCRRTASLDVRYRSARAGLPIKIIIL